MLKRFGPRFGCQGVYNSLRKIRQMVSQSSAFHEALEILDDFFHLMDSRRLFTLKDPDAYRRLRRRVRRALFTVLMEGRPRLENLRGLSWPYDAFLRNRSYLETVARGASPAEDRLQARLFLALLPFPGQWRELLRLENRTDRHPEIVSLLAEEQRKIDAKIVKKRQKTFRLRHFCQILKVPRPPAEKGALRIFSLPYLFRIPGLLKRISKEYVIYMEPPWGVLARHAWLRVFSDLEDPCLIGAGGPEDRRFLETQAGVVPVPLAHGDYLEEDGTVPLGAEKRFDIVFNGLYDDMPRKRHNLLLELLCRPELSRLTALFIGRGASRHVAAFRRQVGALGLENRVTVRDNLPRREVPRYLARCRMGVHLALHENVCRSIYECFRSDIPCLVSSAMAGFDFHQITPQNGVVAPDDALPAAVCRMLDHLDPFSPRKWFLDHSGCRNNSRRLNDHLKVLFERQGYPWENDIVLLGSSGANRYVDPEDYRRFRPAFHALLAVFREFPLPLAVVPE